ncbi:ATP-binding protein [Bradyrhizobium erythrophlei]|uniref:Histidine kinase-, DNA gyrase B-, and HSP90-like ATPase n=1 Tax=Bradyrhizobium erythrophlei TaxID=1437360 RepID=A0A1M7T198_9BRAD|nr:ATP-binding protein [Bradyrhizobium erythrophlei]SHN64540.1 Histidine kinase-, DNA gyrase B-, and HSP90-like ATPase [Bradyrhizobium erythrophlei]
MWKRLPLRFRLFLPTIGLLAATLLFGIFALEIFSPDQFENESEDAAGLVRTVTKGLNEALAVAENPEPTLEAFAAGIGSGDAIRYRKADVSVSRPKIRLSTDGVPGWFVSLLRIPNLSTAHPIVVGEKHVGDILFVPDLTPDLNEKWLGFLAIVLSGSALLVLAAVSAYLTTTLALRPLEQLGAGLARMQQGDYDSTIPLLGPPEIRKSCEEANQLARKLKRLAQDNRSMLRKLVSLQDDEREEIAKELHDELGPLLFAIRANAIALSGYSTDPDPEAPSNQLLEAAGAVQQASRRILEGLSPLYLEELGLEKSIETLLQNAHAALPSVATSAEVDPRLDSLDHLMSQTIYRVIQEAITNVIKHAQATTLSVVAAMRDSAVTIEVSDDGIGFSDNVLLGRGLTGMSDRSRALDGKLDLLREDGRTVVRCWLPLAGARAD